MERRPVLCIIAGPNGAGKTSTTIRLLQDEWSDGCMYINPDNIAQEKYGDWNSPDAVLKAAQEATRQRYKCLTQRVDFVFETVLSSEEKVEFQDNSVDGQMPRLLFRSVDGRLFKQYTDDTPEWAQILKEHLSDNVQ